MNPIRKRILAVCMILGAVSGSWLGWHRAPRTADAAEVAASAR